MYYIMYGSLVTLISEETDDAVVDEFDAILADTMLGEISRGSL